jgi:hypothetical protein
MPAARGQCYNHYIFSAIGANFCRKIWRFLSKKTILALFCGALSQKRLIFGRKNCSNHYIGSQCTFDMYLHSCAEMCLVFQTRRGREANRGGGNGSKDDGWRGNHLSRMS